MINRIVVLIVLLASSVAHADSPAVCAPVEETDKYRLLRQLSLDLLGRPPTVEEYQRLEGQDDVPASTIESMLDTEEFYAQLRRYHRKLIWTALDGEVLFNNRITLKRNNASSPWSVGSRAKDFRRAYVGCLDQVQTQFDAQGRPIPLCTNRSDDAIPSCADCSDADCQQEGYVEVQPYWADEPIRVCAYDAQTQPFGFPKDGEDVACTNDTTIGGPLYNAGCGCGPNLKRCVQEGPQRQQLVDALVEEPLRILEHMVRNGRPYIDGLRSRETLVNGVVAHVYREIAYNNVNNNVLGDGNVGAMPEIPYGQQAWVPVTRPRPHSGLLTTLAYLQRFASYRGRVNRFYSAFLCQPFVSTAALEPASNDCNQNPDLSKRCGCTTCHGTIEPARVHWGRFRKGVSYGYLDATSHPTFRQNCADCGNGQCDRTCSEYYATSDNLGNATPEQMAALRGTLEVLAWRTEQERAVLDAGPSGLVDANERAVAACASQNLFEHLVNRPLNEAEREQWLPAMTDRFERNGQDFRKLLVDIVQSDVYRRLR